MYVLQRESDRICGLGKRRKNERMPETFGLRQAIRRKQRGKAMKVQIEITKEQIKSFAEYMKQQAIVNNFTAGDFATALDYAKIMVLRYELQNNLKTLEEIKKYMKEIDAVILEMIQAEDKDII